MLAAVLIAQLAMPQAASAAGSSTAVSVQSAYDGNGNAVSRTDGNGLQTQYTYDVMNRITGIDYPGGSSPDVSFTFDLNGNRATMTDMTGVTTFGHDRYDRLTRVDYPDGGFVVYGYDYVGNVTELIYGNTKAVAAGKGYTSIEYTYDEDNRIATVKDVFASTVTSYTYNDAGNPLRRTLPNGVTTDYAYDGDGRLISVDHKKADGSRICKYAFTLNAIGNRTQVQETLPDGSVKTTSFTYDVLDRLGTASYPDGRTVAYLYDSFGNRTKMTEVTGSTTKVTDYVHDSDSRLLSTSVNGTAHETFQYDATGNLIQRVRATDNRQIDYFYDAENRLVRFYDGTNNVQYIYNGAGHRVAKIVNGVQVNYVNDIKQRYVQVLTETDSGGNAQRVYQWGNELIDQKSGLGRGYHLYESVNGSVGRLVDSTGGVLNAYAYDAFGTPITKTEAHANDYQFHGECQEEDAGLVFLRSRFLDSSLGRFTSRDQARAQLFSPSSLNRYAYVENDPVNKTDPNGDVAPLVLGVVGVITGAAATGAYILTTPAAERTTAGVLSSFAAGAAAPIVGFFGGSAALATGVALSAGAIQGAVTSKAQSIGGGILDASLGAVLNHPTIGLATNFRNTTRISGLLTNSNVRNVASEVANQFYTGVVGSMIQDNLVKPTRDFFNPSSASKPVIGNFDHWLKPGGVALNKSASVLLDINTITGGTYDPVTGQLILFGKKDTSPTALPKMSLDDFAVAVRAHELGSFPVVSIEDPVVTNQPQWPGRTCFTVRYGPFHTDPLDGQRKVIDLSSKTHFGWVMFEADRLMKSLGLGKDNRTLQGVSSSVQGYKSWLTLALDYFREGNFTTRFWFNPKEIVVQPSADGRSMQISKAEMQLSTETMFASNGQMESTPDAEYFSTWFTNNYDAIAEEQVSLDDAGQPHKIFKELKQLAYLSGIVKWIKDNNIPVDLGLLKDYQAAYFDSAPSVTPQTSVSGQRVVNSNGIRIITATITGGVNFCNDLVTGSGGNPTGLGAAATSARPAETALGWSFNSGGQNYNATALSVDRTEKPGGVSPSAADATFKVPGSAPLVLGRYFDSFSVTPTLFGWGWKAQPYALEFRGNRETFSLCHQTWDGYGEVWFMDRAAGRGYKFVPSGTYDRVADPQGLASRFAPGKDILVYRFESKGVPGLLFSDNHTHMTMRLHTGELLDFNFDGLLTQVEDRNGNRIHYSYDASKRLTSMGQPGGRTIALSYNAQNRVATASLPGSRTVTYTYSAGGDLISAQADAPTGRIARYSYDASHNLLQVQDESGNASATQTVDAFGRVNVTTQPGVGTPFTQTYNLASRTAQMTGPNGAASATEFNASNDPVRMTDARGNATTMTYNSYRDVTSITTPDQQTRQIYYDGSGRTAATVMPNNRVDRVFYNSFGMPTETFHAPLDAAFNNSFNAEHVMTSSAYTYYLVNHTEREYDLKGNLVSITDANSRTRRFGYDAVGNMAWSEDARGRRTTFTYDSNSRLTRVVNALGHRADMTYDSRDNLLQVTTQAGVVDFTYNSKNQVSSVTTGNAGARRTTTYGYNAKGQISSVTDPAAKVTQYAYDDRGNLTGVVHDGISRFSYEHDGMNRVTATRYTGTAGGTRPSLVPTAPVGGELFRGNAPLTIKWLKQGDWTGNANVTIQYSIDGVNWTNIATVAAANGAYTWNTPVNSNTLRIRFVRSGDSGFRASTTAPFMQVSTVRYYVNDSSTAGDQYCTAAGQAYNGSTVTGRSPSNPVTDPQSIIENNVLQPGDIIHIDTGSYNLTRDIVITEADKGSSTLPVTIQGPTSGPGAVLNRSAIVNAVILCYDTNTSDANPLQGIAIRNIKTVGSKRGIWLNNGVYCTISQCECSQASLPGSASVLAGGEGIFVNGGGNNLIERNILRNNGGNGQAGTGGPGEGSGIICQLGSANVIRFNECHGNKGTGGTSTVQAGLTQGFGIQLLSCSATQLTDNVCRDQDATGTASTAGLPGDTEIYGILAISNTGSIIERNTCHGNDATGGSSTGNDGGYGISMGMMVSYEPNARLANNICHSNTGVGGLSSTEAAFANGSGEGNGIRISSCAGAIAINNRCHGNFGNATTQRVSEGNGGSFGMGLKIEASTGCTIIHNTIERNRGFLDGSSGISSSSATGGQLYLHSGSTGAVVKNNALGSPDLFAPCIRVATDSRTGISSDHNDLYPVPGGITSGAAGQWGNSVSSSISGWRAASGQDANSLNVNPQFYDQAAGNYHLRATSPLIGAAVTLAGAGADIDGENRPQQGPNPGAPLAADIGADEFKDSDGDTLADAIETTVTLTNANDEDSDDDGLPDGWEVANALNPNSAAGAHGAAGDPDGDTYTNMQEYLGHSDPQLTASIPAQPPVITHASPAELNPFLLEEDSLAFTAHATDANGETIGYSWRLDGEVKSTTSTYHFATTDVSSGATTLSKSHSVELSVTAGGDVVTRGWTVTVGNRNHPPVLQPLGTVNVRPGQTIQLNPVYSDPDNQNAATGDDNVLTLSYTGFMTGPMKTVSAADIGTHTAAVSVRDDGTPALSVAHSFQIHVINAGAFVSTAEGAPLTVIEGGPGGSYSLALNSPPAAAVTISIHPGTQVAASPASLVFTAANWNQPQAVTVTAVNNNVAEGSRSGTVTHTATSADAVYHGAGISSVEVNVQDNDVASVLIVESGGGTAATEGGAGDDYTVALGSQPAGTVTIHLNPDDQATAAPSMLTFTSANWNVPQTVAVAAVNDDMAEGAHTAAIAHAASSADPKYGGMAIASVMAAVTDNDIAGIVLVLPGGGSAVVTEGGDATSYTLALKSEPRDPVTVHLNAGSQLSTAPSSVTFTPASWKTARTVTVSAVGDTVAEGAHTGEIAHTATSTDSTYHGIVLPGFAVTIRDRPADDWRHSHFSAAELADPAVSGDDADANHNGIPNLVEYALHGDPKAASPGQRILPQVSRDTPASGLQMTFLRYLDRTDITLTIQASDEAGGPWTDLARSVHGAPFEPSATGVIINESGSGNARAVVVGDPPPMSGSSYPRRFMRLQVTR
ncbi:MAG: RHS repeat-associated core domain-containing protein [Prosthecobacter sp.]